MEAVEWRDSSRRLVRDWKPKARRYLAAWRRAGGSKKEAALLAGAATQEEAAAREAARKAAGAQRFKDLEAHAAAGRWLEVLEGEREWQRLDPVQFEFYRTHKRPKAWAQHVAGAQKRPQAA